MDKSDFLNEEEVVVEKINDGIPTDDFVSISHPTAPKRKKKSVDVKSNDDKLANVAKLLGDLSAEDLQKVIASLNAASQTSKQSDDKSGGEEKGDAQKPIIETEQPRAEIVPAEEKARFSFDEEINNDVPVVVEIIDDDTIRVKQLSSIRATLRSTYDKCIQTKNDADNMKNPVYKKIYLDAINARMDFIHYVLLKTTDDDWLIKTMDSIGAMYKAEVSQFLEEVDTYPLAIGCPKDLNEYISRRYIVDYFYTKRKYVEAISKCSGVDFDAKLKVFKHDAYQEPKKEVVKPSTPRVSKPISYTKPTSYVAKPTQPTVSTESKNSTPPGIFDWSAMGNAILGSLYKCTH